MTTMRVENDLKPHNVETIKRILEFYKTSNKCCAIQATGTGKTYLILRLLEIYNDMDKCAVVFAPNREIINQTKKRMKKFGLNNATFYTYQKLARMTDDEIENINAALIVCDELHRTGAKTWGEKFEVLVETHPDSKVFGVTATPLRCADGRDMAEEYFDGNKACNISLAEALVRKIIPVMPVYVSALYTFEEEYKNMSDKIENGRNSDEEKAELIKELKAAKQQLEKSNGIPEIIKKYITNYNGKYIVFCKDKKHLYEMKDVVIQWFRDAGYNGKIFDYPYYSNNNEVKRNLTNFENNEEDGLKLLFVIDKLNEGLHLDVVHGCILLRTTTSNIIYYQQIGRAIDAGCDQKRVILDLVSNFNSLKTFNFKEELGEKIIERQNGKLAECSKEFDIEEFYVNDYVQKCVDVFSGIDKKISCAWWSNEEDRILIENYDKLKINELILLFSKYGYNRDKYSIRNRCKILGLKKLYSWTKDEEIIMEKYYPIEGINVYKRLNNKTVEQCQTKAHNMGLKSNKRKPDWNDDEKNILIQFYETEGASVYKRLDNRSPSSCTVMARKLGLTYQTKNPKYVTYHQATKKYHVMFTVNGKAKSFGYYKSKDEACKIAMEKAKEYGKI